MDMWPGSHVQHVKPKQQTNKCQMSKMVIENMGIFKIMPQSSLLNAYMKN
jgi:hypothetical protein